MLFLLEHRQSLWLCKESLSGERSVDISVGLGCTRILEEVAEGGDC